MRNLKRNEVDINNSMISIGLGLGRIKNPEERIKLALKHLGK